MLGELADTGHSHLREIQAHFVPVMPPEAIRTLPFGTGLVLLRSAPPIVADLRPWTVRDDADRLIAGRVQTETTVRGSVG